MSLALLYYRIHTCLLSAQLLPAGRVYWRSCPQHNDNVRRNWQHQYSYHTWQFINIHLKGRQFSSAFLSVLGTLVRITWRGEGGGYWRSLSETYYCSCFVCKSKRGLCILSHVLVNSCMGACLFWSELSIRNGLAGLVILNWILSARDNLCQRAKGSRHSIVCYATTSVFGPNMSRAYRILADLKQRTAAFLREKYSRGFIPARAE